MKPMKAMSPRQARERQQRRNYAIAMEEKFRQEQREIKAMEMLLDAEWINPHQVFMKITKGVTPQGNPYHVERFYDRQGNEVERPKGPQRMLKGLLT